LHTPPHPTDPPPLAAPLRAAARGICPTEAAVDLLITHGVFLRRRDFTTHFVQQGTHLADGTQLAEIEWSTAINALDGGDLPCSRSEAQLLRLAASLTEGIPLNLHDAVTCLDNTNIGRVTHAIRHASGHRPHPS
jgi:hypothetical protein